MRYLVTVRPGGEKKWVTLSEHADYSSARRAWFGWMTILHTNHNAWFIDSKKGNVMGRPFRPEKAKQKGGNPFNVPDDGRNPKAILEALESRGVTLLIDGHNLRKGSGDITLADREDITACKTEIMMILKSRQDRELARQEWDGSRAANYIREAQATFKQLWDVLHDPANLGLAAAAFAVLTDSIGMLSEAVTAQDLTEVQKKSAYVGWLCDTVRQRINEANAKGMAFNQRPK